jgi:hypothetical protein
MTVGGAIYRSRDAELARRERRHAPCPNGRTARQKRPMRTPVLLSLHGRKSTYGSNVLSPA